MRVESTIRLLFHSCWRWNVPRCHFLNDVDEGTVGGRVGAGLFETSFAPTYSHVRIMTDLFGINNIYNKEEKNHQQ